MSSIRQILTEKMRNKNHEGLLKHPVDITTLACCFMLDYISFKFNSFKTKHERLVLVVLI